jgi:exosortase A-associated hydrolase 1
VRRLIAFDCEGETLIGTLDSDGPASLGVLVVSGGNEVRAGAHRGMALLAARLAEDGLPVFRYDRRGIGDSGGRNRGWTSAAPDLAAALATFRREAGVTRVVGFGNCDAASLLAIEGRRAGLEAVVLANPWTVETDDGLPPAAAIRAGYAAKLRRPSEWVRLLRGGVDLRKLARGIAKLLRSRPQPLARQVVRAVARWGERATIVLAEGDATALAFVEAARDAGLRAETIAVPTASHGFARAADQVALENAIRWALRRL